ncbi:ABC transporter substrate-binding protein [Myceligenerans xiligouense]|uniref:Monosaccharide ABC transporter substrate-binding protein (CUT2 family) n=1 Tax=Myceligenerans xiligouense TaxID=253184 RepID=A0A3N4YS30_9MICO|nr:ABC transporter substrate-binding protein [Myceligenerans xiligouense]RPF23017.1 monosaccharide ABC transporter substrate-binding protein (CUT2 family) [Myceligenerans xiligouense]
MARHTFARTTLAALSAVTLLALGACSSEPPSSDGGDGAEGGGDELISVGFSQVGAESGWRSANTMSIKDALTEENGFELSFSDAQQKQENQISAIRNYIAQGVDVIAFSPVVETGWDAVLEEAKGAGIPVVLTDRAVETTVEDAYVSFIGSDFVEEGARSGEWAVEQYDGEGYKVVELQGTTGSAPAIDRQQGFADAIEGSDLEVIDSQTGDFTRDGGKKVMEGFLTAHDDIDLVFAHNDDMGLGAVEAIEAAGMTPGEDIKIITIDGVKDGMAALAEGKFNYIVECNPLLGPDLAEVIQKTVAGEDVEERIVTQDEAFDQEGAKEALPDRQY